MNAKKERPLPGEQPHFSHRFRLSAEQKLKHDKSSFDTLMKVMVLNTASTAKRNQWSVTAVLVCAKEKVET